MGAGQPGTQVAVEGAQVALRVGNHGEAEFGEPGGSLETEGRGIPNPGELRGQPVDNRGVHLLTRDVENLGRAAREHQRAIGFEHPEVARREPPAGERLDGVTHQVAGGLAGASVAHSALDPEG